MNKNQIQKITQIEQLIAETKQSLKTWANQISKHHKTLKELTSQLNSLKEELNMNKNPTLNQPNQKNK